MKIFIETERLLMRELTDADAPGLFALDSDPEVHRYLGNKPVKSLQASEDIVRHVRRQYAENGIGRWAVIDKKTMDFIGWSGLKYETNLRAGARYYDLGYRIRRQYWGQGIATETAVESLKYGFKKLDLPRICAAAHRENTASNKILIKTGFRLIETFEYDGAVHNWYELERADWEEKSRR
ncbi:MAG: GNAT family N-acetyltransferase [Saprospiraceae bacterium]|nr:GNAT family N-acetyltransferase [Saprospiraceae bacterium]